MLKLTESLLIYSCSFFLPKYPEFLDSFFPIKVQEWQGNSVLKDFGGGTLIVQTTPRKAMCELHESPLWRGY